MNDRLRILIVAANPKDLDRLHLREELTQLRNRMNDNVEHGNAEVLVEWAARAFDLQSAVRKNRPHIVHFAGHGNHEGIWLEDDEGKSQLLSKESLPLILGASPDLRLVVLNACATASQTEALRRTVEYVVGTPAPIKDSVALDFTTHFYRGLAVGDKIRDAFCQAQERLGGYDHERYQLFVREDVDEGKPLIPPSAHRVTRAQVEELNTDLFEGANRINEGIRSPGRETGNQRSELVFRSSTVKAKTFRLANEINRSTARDND